MIAWWIRAGTKVAVRRHSARGPVRGRSWPAALNTWSPSIGDLAVRPGGPAAHRTPRRGLVQRHDHRSALGGMLAYTSDAPASRLFWTITLWCARPGSGAADGPAPGGWRRGRRRGPGGDVERVFRPEFLAARRPLVAAGDPLDGRRTELRKPGPWAAALVAGCVFAPNVVWNAQHHWLTFSKQFGRVAPHGVSLGHVGDFIGTQILVFTPLMAVYAILGVRQAWRERGEAGAVQPTWRCPSPPPRPSRSISWSTAYMTGCKATGPCPCSARWPSARPSRRSGSARRRAGAPFGCSRRLSASPSARQPSP